MTGNRPNSKRNLDIAIERAFGHTDNTLQIRTIMANTIIGQLLPLGAVKGGSALKLRYGNATTRFTTDLDTSRGMKNSSLYMHRFSNEIDSQLLLDEGKLITMWPHTRFAYFPKHTHNYIEMVYMCHGTTTHRINDHEIIQMADKNGPGSFALHRGALSRGSTAEPCTCPALRS